MSEINHNQHSKQLRSSRAVMNAAFLVILVVVLLKPFTVIAIESPYGNSSCVEYDREGELYLVKNDCSSIGGGCTHQRIDLEQAIEYARQYQWIDVSASMKRPGHALWEAELKLLGIDAKGLVMIYLPQGIEAYATCGGLGTAWFIEAVRMRYGGHYPVDHSKFQDTFSQLIAGATEGNRKVMVTSKSYGAHQAVEVFHDNPNVFHVSIGPSFGIFQEDDESADGKNSHIQTYIDNLARARSKMCIVTSYNDCWSLNAYGSALSRHNEELFQCNDYENPKHPSDYIAPVPEYCYESLSARWDCMDRGLLPPPRGHQPISNDCYGGASRCYVYGNMEVYDAIYRNRNNVKTVTVQGAGHYTPSYYDHGLIRAMQQCPDVHGLQGSFADKILNDGAAYYCRQFPFRVEVDDLVGRDTRCVTSGGQGTLTLRLQNLECGTPYCKKGTVKVISDGVLLSGTVRDLTENSSRQVRVRGDRIVLQATCGSKRTEKIVHLDNRPPEIRGISVTPHQNQEGAFIVAANVEDDGYWVGRDWSIRVNIDGVRREDSGRSITLEDLSPGTHAGTVRISDGCGRLSQPEPVSFVVSETPPELSFVKPRMNRRIRRGGHLDIVIRASAEGGVKNVSIYLDRISEDEFDYRKICYIPGVFGVAGPERKSCNRINVPENAAMWNRGSHTLIGVVESNSGIKTTVRRTFRIR
jgi:hypothetical protein